MAEDLYKTDRIVSAIQAKFETYRDGTFEELVNMLKGLTAAKLKVFVLEALQKKADDCQPAIDEKDKILATKTELDSLL